MCIWFISLIFFKVSPYRQVSVKIQTSLYRFKAFLEFHQVSSREKNKKISTYKNVIYVRSNVPTVLEDVY